MRSELLTYYMWEEVLCTWVGPLILTEIELSPLNNYLFGASPVTSLRELLILVRFMFLLKLLMNESFQEISHFFSGSSLVACFLRL